MPPEFTGYSFRPLVPLKERGRISQIWVSHLICGHFSLQSCTHIKLKKEQNTVLLSVQPTLINWTFTIMSCSKTLKFFFWFQATERCIYISMYAVPLLEGRYTVIGKAAHEVIEWTTIPTDHLPLQLSSPGTHSLVFLLIPLNGRNPLNI